MRRTVHLKHLRPSETVPALAPYSHVSGAIIAMDSEQILVLQDYAANVRQQLKLLEELEHKHSMD